MMKKILMAVFSLLPSTVFAALPQDGRYPGGIAVIPVQNSVSSASMGENKLALVVDAGKKYILAGIPLTAQGSITITTMPSQNTFTLAIGTFHYKEQHITLKDQDNKVTPNNSELERYAQEAKEQTAVYQSFTTGSINFPLFIKPTHGVYASPFGFKRFFNGQPRAPHAGLDIAAPQGQAVLAPANGTIVQTGNYFFNGNTVMIDHGQGIISMLCHLSKINVSKGDTVNQGQTIGLVGKTGRATGPHLHWSVSFNNVRINPRLLLDH